MNDAIVEIKSEIAQTDHAIDNTLFAMTHATTDWSKDYWTKAHGKLVCKKTALEIRLSYLESLSKIDKF